MIPTFLTARTACKLRGAAFIYPDASSVDLDGMMGLDSHGNSG